MPGISQATTKQLATQLESITHKNIIFDLTGVLLDVSQRFLLSEIGYLNMVWYSIRHMKNPLNAFKILFTLLDQIHPSTEEQYTYKDNKVPKFICDWGMGRMNSTEIKTICKKAFDEFDAKQGFASSIEKKIMHIAIEKLFDPQLIVDKTFTPMKGNIALVKKLVEKKDSQGNRLHKVYLLSNLDNEVYELLLKKYPELFNLFDGRLISAEVGSLKPDPKIYQELLTRYNLNPAECFFIDDQADNIVASKELGIAGAQYV